MKITEQTKQKAMLEREIEANKKYVVDIFLHYLKIDPDNLDSVAEIEDLIDSIVSLCGLKLEQKQQTNPTKAFSPELPVISSK
ncbi:hypothetical protein [Aliterella atlantica]|uniref:Uncharacterized protein n=1 Tax=Aliterella atlantica CENA595 TaxID=1618023 RepID=A0A0D8ZNC9_9CYAN|nr:hypothetical protein [Aliterella atlantica]KJH70250.1 hypothetical protein UH38_19060 [Aliterella atlantica CENA595]